MEGLTGSGTMGDGLTNGGCFAGPKNKKVIIDQSQTNRCHAKIQSEEARHSLWSYQMKVDLLMGAEMVHVSVLEVYDL